MTNEHSTESAAGPTYLIHSYEHRAYHLPEERPFTIGRDVSSDIMVNEVFVSRHHAELRPDGYGYTLHPTGSTPTLVNDTQVTGAYTLRDGDTFTIGTMKFVFTRGRLPVAMSVAEPGGHLISGVDDRRPTLTFPLPGAGGTRQDNTGTPVWIVLVAVVLLAALAIYWFM
jgi:pSer/pThr/pTyr-binding forkhead associated (FHA) protein